jgi:ribonuclease D
MYAYRERVCLIQISIPEQDYLIDPLVHLDLKPLGAIISDPAVEKVFHAAEYDLTLLKREFGWELNNLFDTMWAARILGYPRYSLANMLEEFFQIKLNKRYQKSNWCRRPLSRAQRIYAQLDTHYLLSLRDQLDGELERAGCLEEAHETFREQTRVKLSNNEFTPDSFWSINGVNELGPQQKAILKALGVYRDQEAKRRNKPLFKVFNNRTLIELAQVAPKNQREMRPIHGMTEGQIRRYGRQILQAIHTGLNAPPPIPQTRSRRPPDSVLNRYDKLHRWRKKRAQARGVESDVIVSRDTLWAIAEADPRTVNDLDDINELGSWRSQTYGREILDILLKK